MIRAVFPNGGREVEFVIQGHDVTVVAPPGYARVARETANLATRLADAEASPRFPSYEILVRDHLAALLPGLETRQVAMPPEPEGAVEY